VHWQEQVFIHSTANVGGLPFLYCSNFNEFPLRLRKPSPHIQIPASELHRVTQDVITEVQKLRRSTLSTDKITRFGHFFLVVRHVSR